MNTAKLLGGAATAGALVLGTAGIAFAQTNYTGTPSANTVAATTSSSSSASTTGTGTTGTTGTTPGTPNTGAGGDATTNALILTASALAVALGGWYLARGRMALE